MALLSLYSCSFESKTALSFTESDTPTYEVLAPVPQKVVNITGNLNMSVCNKSDRSETKRTIELVGIVVLSAEPPHSFYRECPYL